MILSPVLGKEPKTKIPNRYVIPYTRVRVSCDNIGDEHGRIEEPTAERRATENGGWTRDYVLLTLRIARTVEARTGDGRLFHYYGPPEWKALVDAEEPRPGGALLEEVLSAEEALSGQDFEPGRKRYLGKHLLALGTVARRLAGERLSLEEQAAECFDLEVGWVRKKDSRRPRRSTCARCQAGATFGSACVRGRGATSCREGRLTCCRGSSSGRSWKQGDAPTPS
jgi:hypothetical protein